MKKLITIYSMSGMTPMAADRNVLSPHTTWKDPHMRRYMVPGPSTEARKSSPWYAMYISEMFSFFFAVERPCLCHSNIRSFNIRNCIVQIQIYYSNFDKYQMFDYEYIVILQEERYFKCRGDTLKADRLILIWNDIFI